MKARKIMSFVVACATLLSVSAMTFAESISETAIRIDAPNPDPAYVYEIEPRGGSYFSTKVLRNYVNEKKSNGYLTDSWAKCSGYDRTKTKSVSLTFKGSLTKLFAEKAAADLNLSASIGSSVTQHIPANPNRYSKLQQSTLYSHKNVQVTQHYIDTGNDIVKSGDLYTPIDIYVDVVYQ